MPPSSRDRLCPDSVLHAGLVQVHCLPNIRSLVNIQFGELMTRSWDSAPCKLTSGSGCNHGRHLPTVGVGGGGGGGGGGGVNKRLHRGYTFPEAEFR